MNKEHVCDERCNCPECGSPCHYSPRLNLHACSNVCHCRWLEPKITFNQAIIARINAGLAEQADAPDLKSEDAMHRGGSIPPSGTISALTKDLTYCPQCNREIWPHYRCIC